MPEDSRATLRLLARVSSTLPSVIPIIGEHHRHLQSIFVNSTKFEFDRAICRKLSSALTLRLFIIPRYPFRSIST